MTAKKIPTHTQQNTKPTKAHSEKEALDLLKVETVPTVKAKAKKRRPLDLGRPSEITPAITDEICKTISESGAHPEIVAQSLGVPLSTFEGRMRDDEGFKRRITGARTACEVGLATQIKGAGTWHGAAWILERTSPERYAPKAYIAIDARMVGGMGDLELEKIIHGIVQRRGLDKPIDSETGQDEPVEMVNGPDGEYQALD